MHHQSRGRRSGNRGIGSGSSSRSQSLLDRSPLMGSGGQSRNENLQLHDLDLELALLKRKRELIEQQQNMLINDQPYSRSNQYMLIEDSFGQSEINEPRSGAARDFGSFYGEHATAEPVYVSRYDRKRPAPTGAQWPATVPKRYLSHSSRGRNRSRSQRPSNAAQAAPGPLRPAQPQRPAHIDAAPGPSRPAQALQHSNRPPAPKNRKFKPAKVTKPANNSAPNNLQSYPIQERKDLINKTLNTDEYILSEDQPASSKLTGRLELALGFYLKELRTQNESGPFAAVFSSPFKQRLLKKSIRERIRIVMLGKKVGQAKDIMAAVRAAYPVSSDADILQPALETEPSNSKLAISPVDAVDPETYIRTNFNMLLGRKLNEMFAKLQEIYKKDGEVGESTAQIVDNMMVEMAMGDTQNTNEVALKPDQPTEPKGDQPSAEAIETPKVEAPIEPIENPLKEVPEPAVELAPSENIEKDSNTNDVGVANTNNVSESVPASTKFQEDIKMFDLKYPQGGVIDKPAVFYNHLVDKLIKRRLYYVLPRYKDQLIQILRSDSGYTETKAYLLQQANKKAEKLYGQLHAEKNKDNSHPGKQRDAQAQRDSKGNKDQKQQKYYPYFVKILGRPSLPKRNKMQVFLDTFNPASIKKHRGIHNLLFVALHTQEDYEKILNANKTVVGNSTLEIHISTKGSRGDDNPPPVVIKTEPESEVKVEAGVITDQKAEAIDKPLHVLEGASNEPPKKMDVASDEPVNMLEQKVDSVNSGEGLEGSLDDQISDLLMSIRNGEAETNGSGETDDLQPDTVEVQNEDATDDQNTNEPTQDLTDDVQLVEDESEPEVIHIDDSQSEKIKEPKEVEAELPSTPRTTRRASRLAQK